VVNTRERQQQLKVFCKLERRKIKNPALAVTSMPHRKDLAVFAYVRWKDSPLAKVRAHQLLHVLPNEYGS